jgi:3'(2'), 5'-bisphosphate nucleotidase
LTASLLLQTLVDAALEAGAEIEAIYGAGCAHEVKEDGSPVTIADQRAEAIILARLAAAFPDVPVVAEEEACAGRIPECGDRFFLVDPLDGTKGFIQRNGEFTVNIGLIEQGAPVAGVVYAPDSGLLYYGAKSEGAFRRQVRGEAPAEAIRVRPRPASGLTAIGSRNHHAQGTEARNAALGIVDYLPSGSSLKFCLLADGSADVYPRYGRTMEWDTAAGQAVLEAAGGRVMALDGDREAGPLRYGKPDFANPHFIAWAT